MLKRPEQIPFVELTECAVCHGQPLQKVHDQTYAGPEGYYRLVIYRCPNGHEERHRQLVVRTPMATKDWEGYS